MSQLVSVIVIIDRRTNHLDKCLESIVKQTYKEVEILVFGEADECSWKIIQAYQKKYKIEYSRSHGEYNFYCIFLNAVSAAKGEYFAFIDGNDYISVDWLRMLVKGGIEANADVAISDFMCYTEDGTRYYYNLDPLRITDICLKGMDCIKNFCDYSPECTPWRSMGNKLWKRRVILEAAKRLEESFECLTQIRINEYLKTALLVAAFESTERAINVHNVNYFCYESGKRKPDINVAGCISEAVYFLKRYKKTALPFKGIKGIFERYLKQLKDMHPDTFEMESLLALLPDENLEQEMEALDLSYFDSITTVLDPVYDSYEMMKSCIADRNTEYVSFDIFDTLILRKVLEPADIFRFLNEDFNRLMDTVNYIDFGKIRRISEDTCRKRIFALNPSFEDITLDEIYDQIKRDFCFSESVLEQIKQKEKELELYFCIQRKTGKELYELALYSGKKILCISDMYLPLELVEKILKKNGYDKLERIFLSSDIRLGKYTCNLYKHVKSVLEIPEGKQIVHIGDNWAIDVENGKKCGFKVFHLANGLDLFKGRNPGINMGKYYDKIYQPNGTMVDGRCAIDLYSGIRAMAALAVNRFYECPYVNYNHNTDFNANPYFIGYFCVGSHLFALAKWLLSDVIQNRYSKIHFLGRDGYLPFEAYKIVTHDMENIPKAEYTYMSRSMIPLCDIRHKEDVYNILDKMNIITSTPKKIVIIFEEVINSDDLKNMEALCKENGIIYEKELTNYSAAYKFIRLLAERLINYDLLKEQQEKLKKYFTTVFKPNECVFDMGYNGRVETALRAICGYPIDSYYIHSYKEMAYDRGRRSDFQIHTFYDYQPVSTFLIREQIFSKLDASVKNINFNSENNAVLEFEKEEINFETKYCTSAIQNAALDFIRDYMECFGKLENQLNWRYYDASLPFEYYVHKSKYLDRSIFKCVSFEDHFGENISFNLVDYWQNNLNDFKMFSESGNMESTEQGKMPKIYEDGIFMAIYNMVGRRYPIGSKKRERLKRMIKIFLGRGMK